MKVYQIDWTVDAAAGLTLLLFLEVWNLSIRSRNCDFVWGSLKVLMIW